VARGVVAGVLLAMMTVGTVAQDGVVKDSRGVLVLYSNSRLLPANIDVDRALREVLATSALEVEIYDEFLDLPRFGGADHERTEATYLAGKYAARPPEAIVAVGEEALGFLFKVRQDLFPRALLTYCGVGPEFLESLPELSALAVGVPDVYDPQGTIDQALRLHPRARRLVLVTGGGPFGRSWEEVLRREAPRLAGRATVETLAGLPHREVLERLAELGRDAVVFTPGYFSDSDGGWLQPFQSVAEMSAASGAPIYCPYDTLLDAGCVGGVMTAFSESARQTGEIVAAVLEGASPAALRLPAVMPRRLHLDWRELRRWGIQERALPPDAVLHHRPPTFLEQYWKEAIVAASVILVQTLLIGLLAAERRRRRAAESVERARLLELAHVSRVAVAGELTGSIAHEISQPLAAILSNAEAAEIILASGAGTRGELHQILSDIRRDDLRASEIVGRLRSLLARREVDRQLVELNELLREVEAVLRPEARGRRASLDLQPASPPAAVLGDRIQLLQVLINLLLNAMDAVAELPEDRRRIQVTIVRIATGVMVTVRDRGPGIAPDALPKLFDSFYSTKRNGLGLGLSIVRTIVEAHSGRIEVESTAGEGAAFHVELPGAMV
jgi:signal transduction histidine kinase